MPSTDLTRNPKEPRFALGCVVVTPGALRCLEAAGVGGHELLARHAVGDWER